MGTFGFGVLVDEFEDEVGVVLIGVFLFLEVGIEEGMGFVLFFLVLREDSPQ